MKLCNLETARALQELGFGGCYAEEILSEAGEQANIAADHQTNSDRVKRRIYALDGTNY